MEDASRVSFGAWLPNFRRHRPIGRKKGEGWRASDVLRLATKRGCLFWRFVVAIVPSSSIVFLPAHC